MSGMRSLRLGFANPSEFMENKRLSKERIALLSSSVWSAIARYDANAGNLYVEFFLAPFRHEQAKEHSVKGGFGFSRQAIDMEEFNLVVEVFREIAKQLPEAYHVDEGPVSPLDHQSKVLGWFNKEKVNQYWNQGRDEHPLRRITSEVLAKHGIA